MDYTALAQKHGGSNQAASSGGNYAALAQKYGGAIAPAQIPSVTSQPQPPTTPSMGKSVALGMAKSLFPGESFVVGALTRARTEVPQAAQEGAQRATQGAADTRNATTVGGKLAGLLKFGSGVASVVSSPAAPIFSPVGKVFNAASSALEKTPYIQGYARDMSYQPNPTPLGEKILESTSDAGNIANTVLGAKGLIEGAKAIAPEVKSAVADMGTELTAPIKSVKNAAAHPIDTAKAALGTAPEKVIEQRQAELGKIESSSAPVRRAIAKAQAKGIDSKTLLAKTDLPIQVDNTGTIRTQQASAELNDFIAPQEKVVGQLVKREGVTLPLDKIEKRLRTAIDNSGLEGAALDTAHTKIDAEMRGLARRAKGDAIGLDKVQDAKVSKYSTIDYNNEGAKIADKAIARTFKELVSENTKSADVNALNKELQQHYAVLDLLEKLDGKKVEGGRLGKYFAKTVGAIVGGHFGPLGAIAGAEIAGTTKGVALSSKFKGKSGAKLEVSDTMKTAQTRAKAAPLGLPAPKPGTPAQSNYVPIPLRGVIKDEAPVPRRPL